VIASSEASTVCSIFKRFGKPLVGDVSANVTKYWDDQVSASSDASSEENSGANSEASIVLNTVFSSALQGV